MSELFDILNEKGEKTGILKERDAVHRDGDCHGSVHIWICREGKVLLQKRKENKESFPGYYDAAATGHVGAGETFEQAAVRELYEEMHIKARESDFIKAFDEIMHVDSEFLGKRFISNEYTRIFVLKNSVDLSDLSYQKEEISGILWIAFDELLLKLAPDKYCMTEDELLKLKPYLKLCQN